MMRSASSEKQNLIVTLHHGELGELGEGTLSFGDNQWASVSFSKGPIQGFLGSERIDLIKAATKNGRTYSLCKCRIHGHLLYADYFVEADIDSIEFDRIAVRYSDISEWFLRWQRIDGDVGKELVWKRLSEPLSVSVSVDQNQFTLVSEYVGTQERQGEDLVLHEHIEFHFSSEQKKFSLDDVKTKTLELSCLLSILIAYPVTIFNIYAGLKKGHFAQIHFPTFERPKRDTTDTSFWMKYLSQKHHIEDRWQTIFERYYQSKYRKECWIRLSGMQRYDDFWEYKALGYISLLERYVTLYCDQQSKTVQEPPSAKKMAAFQHALTGAIPMLSDDQRNILSQIALRTFSSKLDLSFAQKYNRTIAETDPDVIRVIAMTEEDFRLMKELRDKLAHGADHGLRDDDFTKVSEMVNKITLLLTYWAFLDIGLTTEDFLRCLKNTFHPIPRSAELNQVHLDRITKSAEFFSVSEETLSTVKNVKRARFEGCFSYAPTGELLYSEKYTAIYQAWNKSPSRKYGLQQPKDIFGFPDGVARVVGHGYLECGDDRVEVYSFWIIDSSKIPESDQSSNPST